MFDRFTTEARRVVVVAQELARAEGSKWIDPDHLALASFNDPYTLTMLEGAKADAAPVVEALRRPEIGPPPTGHIPFTPATKQALELAFRRTLALKHKGITGAHLSGYIERIAVSSGRGLAILIPNLEVETLLRTEPETEIERPLYINLDVPLGFQAEARDTEIKSNVEVLTEELIP